MYCNDVEFELLFMALLDVDGTLVELGMPEHPMQLAAHALVSKLSHDMTLEPGDLILCGTSVGVGVMKEKVNTITIAIDGIGELHNEFHL